MTPTGFPTRVRASLRARGQRGHEAEDRDVWSRYGEIEICEREQLADPVTIAIRGRTWPLIGAIAHAVLRLGGAEIPESVPIGRGFRLVHGGPGVVIHRKTTIGDGVTVFQGVTLGRADIYLDSDATEFRGIVVEDNVTLCAGAKYSRS